MKKCLFLVNPVSGKKTIKKYLVDILSILTEGEIIPTVVVTQYRGHATEYVMAHAAAFDMVLCAGGDGTLNECITGLLRADLKIPLGYIPCGSTNDFAESHHIPTSPILAARRLITEKPKPIDIGEINGRYFTYIASFGAFTAASYQAPQTLKNTIGHAAYLLEAARELPTAIRPYRATITAGGKRFRGSFVFGAVANTRSIGGIFKLKEHMVNHSDGLFELAIIRFPCCAADYYTIVKNALSYDFSDKRLRFMHTNKAHIVFEKTTDFTLDGEKLESVTEADIAVHKGAIALF